jgi:hypothetical protein
MKLVSIRLANSKHNRCRGHLRSRNINRGQHWLGKGGNITDFTDVTFQSCPRLHLFSSPQKDISAQILRRTAIPYPACLELLERAPPASFPAAGVEHEAITAQQLVDSTQRDGAMVVTSKRAQACSHTVLRCLALCMPHSEY